MVCLCCALRMGEAGGGNGLCCVLLFQPTFWLVEVWVDCCMGCLLHACLPGFRIVLMGFPMPWLIKAHVVMWWAMGNKKQRLFCMYLVCFALESW